MHHPVTKNFRVRVIDALVASRACRPPLEHTRRSPIKRLHDEDSILERFIFRFTLIMRDGYPLNYQHHAAICPTQAASG